MPGGLARLRAMSARERLQLGWMAATLPLIHGALRTFGYARTRAWLEQRSQHPAPRTANKKTGCLQDKESNRLLILVSY